MQMLPRLETKKQAINKKKAKARKNGEIFIFFGLLFAFLAYSFTSISNSSGALYLI
jgi:hypothetical protein